MTGNPDNREQGTGNGELNTPATRAHSGVRGCLADGCWLMAAAQRLVYCFNSLRIGYPAPHLVVHVLHHLGIPDEEPAPVRPH